MKFTRELGKNGESDSVLGSHMISDRHRSLEPQRAQAAGELGLLEVGDRVLSFFHINLFCHWVADRLKLPSVVRQAEHTAFTVSRHESNSRV